MDLHPLYIEAPGMFISRTVHTISSLFVAYITGPHPIPFKGITILILVQRLISRSSPLPLISIRKSGYIEPVPPLILTPGMVMIVPSTRIPHLYIFWPFPHNPNNQPPIQSPCTYWSDFLLSWQPLTVLPITGAAISFSVHTVLSEFRAAIPIGACHFCRNGYVAYNFCIEPFVQCVVNIACVTHNAVHAVGICLLSCHFLLGGTGNRRICHASGIIICGVCPRSWAGSTAFSEGLAVIS